MAERSGGESSHLRELAAEQPEVDSTKTETQILGIPPAREQPITVVPIESLVLEATPRLSGVAPEHARLLAQAQGVLPPIKVHQPSMRVIDGMHRVQAALLNGHTVIEAQLVDCDDNIAFILAVQANVTHGLPLSHADRRAAARRIIAIRPEWSDRAVGAVVGLSNKTISAVRASAPEEIPQLHTRLGQDGRMHPVNTVARRREAAAMMRENPEAGLRQIARATGLSPATVRDVRIRAARGEDPVPAKYQAAAEGGRTADPKRGGSPSKGTQQPLENLDQEALLEKLSNDPSIRLNNGGRQAMRWLHGHAVDSRTVAKVCDHLPDRWAPVVADLARSCAVAWTALAQELDERVRKGAR